jgi:hypothetical protein
MIFPDHPKVDRRGFHEIVFVLLLIAGVCSAHAADKKFIEFSAARKNHDDVCWFDNVEVYRVADAGF